MMLLTETRERFLLAIAGQVPVEQIAEIHFFQPIRQGGVESGVAVVAAWPAMSVATHDASLDSADASGEERDEQTEREPRPVVYTARYRLTLKGPDRGKWEASVVAEADAPLITVDAVVRGVQRRSGDADVATRIEGADVRAILEAKAG
ncbi:MAG TPA: hypothetical protein VF785_00890 [Gemmatimonadaceae bacterium]